MNEKYCTWTWANLCVKFVRNLTGEEGSRRMSLNVWGTMRVEEGEMAEKLSEPR